MASVRANAGRSTASACVASAIDGNRVAIDRTLRFFRSFGMNDTKSCRAYRCVDARRARSGGTGAATSSVIETRRSDGNDRIARSFSRTHESLSSDWRPWAKAASAAERPPTSSVDAAVTCLAYSEITVRAAEAMKINS